MLVVPLLIVLVGLADKQAFSSAISIILPLTIVSLVIYAKNGALDVGRIAEIIKDDPDCGKNCICGVRVGAFRNEDEIKNELNAVTVGEFFRELTSRAEAAYNE